ncbi:MAG: DUF1571 domain-containing protein [Gemmataceae bacterium]|nr:DUF1571 domain-containing protein [Gemmataceae bacterium]
MPNFPNDSQFPMYNPLVNYPVPRFVYLVLGGFFGLAIVLTGNASNAKPVLDMHHNLDQGNSHENKHPVALEEKIDPMKVPLGCIYEAVKEFQKVKDYKCILIQVERIKGKLLPESQSVLHATLDPKRLHMKWLEPRGLKGQEVSYLPGKDPNKMRVKGAGFLGAVGFLTLDINDAKAMSNNRHKISDAGLASLLTELHDGWKEESRRGKTLVLTSKAACYDRTCIRVELTHPENQDGHFLFFKNIVYFDIESKLPIKIDSYSWPIAGEAPPLEESYGYKDLQLNTGIHPSHLEK